MFRSADIACEKPGPAGTLRIDVAAERLGQPCIAGFGQRPVIGCGAAVIGLPEGAHPARHGEVADPEFAQIVVHVAAEGIETALRQLAAGLALGAQPTQEQRQMQHDQVETTVERVRNAVFGIESRRSRLRHDRAIEGRDGRAAAVASNEREGHAKTDPPALQRLDGLFSLGRRGIAIRGCARYQPRGAKGVDF